MRQTGAAGARLSPPRFKSLLTIFLDFAGLFGLTASLLRHLSAIRQGWARGDSVTARARRDGWRLRGAGMQAPLILTANYGPGVAEKRRGLAGTGV